MERLILSALMIVLIMVDTSFLASSATISDTIKYEVPNQTATLLNLNLVNNQLNDNLTLQGSPLLFVYFGNLHYLCLY